MFASFLKKNARRISSAVLGTTSMAASLCAIAFVITSDVAVAEVPPRPAQEQVQAVKNEPSEKAQPAVKTVKARPAPKKKRIDLGRFEGY